MYCNCGTIDFRILQTPTSINPFEKRTVSEAPCFLHRATSSVHTSAIFEYSYVLLWNYLKILPVMVNSAIRALAPAINMLTVTTILNWLNNESGNATQAENYGTPNRTLMPNFLNEKIILWYQKFDFWYWKLFFDVRNYFLISELYTKFRFSDIEVFSDIRKSEKNFWYQELLSEIRDDFS